MWIDLCLVTTVCCLLVRHAFLSCFTTARRNPSLSPLYSLSSGLSISCNKRTLFLLPSLLSALPTPFYHSRTSSAAPIRRLVLYQAELWPKTLKLGLMPISLYCGILTSAAFSYQFPTFRSMGSIKCNLNLLSPMMDAVPGSFAW